MSPDGAQRLSFALGRETQFTPAEARAVLESILRNSNYWEVAGKDEEGDIVVIQDDPTTFGGQRRVIRKSDFQLLALLLGGASSSGFVSVVVKGDRGRAAYVQLFISLLTLLLVFYRVARGGEGSRSQRYSVAGSCGGSEA